MSLPRAAGPPDTNLRHGNTPVLCVENLDIAYGGKPVLRDVCFEVAPGSFTAVIGPNGCGKTTLVKALLKTLAPDAGTIRLFGNDLQSLSNKDLARQMAAVLQTIDPAPMTVRDYVLMGRMPFFAPFQFFESKKDMEIAENYMALTGVLRLARKKITRVSGGERQLCAIARALTQEPALLLLDEPTAHLDITHQKRILDLISALKGKLSLTVLMVLHDLNLAAEYADRLVLLHGISGQAESRVSSVYASGSPQTVLTRDAIEAVYRTRVTVRPNPISGNPLILLTKDENTHEPV
ncbi:MAG: ABC transporter ATP-binding protein [Desulfobacterales bacterium]|nr:ABC transporter ATP-binding protein [Desulfobacterales bacterium]